MMLRANREFARFRRLFRGRARRRLNAMLLLIHLLKVFLELHHGSLPVNVFLRLYLESPGSAEASRV